jgi:hypothetical protein
MKIDEEKSFRTSSVQKTLIIIEISIQTNMAKNFSTNSIGLSYAPWEVFLEKECNLDL